ncbi:MAG: Spy/CpxP family protein refolding chaperone [Cyanobacteria bacterium J06597_16]
MKRRLNLANVGTFIAITLVIVGTKGFQTSHYISNAAEEASAMTTSRGLKSRGGSALSAIENLTLTPTQEDEIEAIKAEMMAQMAEVLTPEQMETFQTAQSSGNNTRSVMMSLGLDASQRSEVIGLMRITEGKIMAALTPDQRAQIEGESPRDRK